MSTKIPVFDYGICVACGICVVDCPLSSLELCRLYKDNHKKAYPVLTDRHCSGCSLCQKHCPMGAITMQEAE